MTEIDQEDLYKKLVEEAELLMFYLKDNPEPDKWIIRGINLQNIKNFTIWIEENELKE